MDRLEDISAAAQAAIVSRLASLREPHAKAARYDPRSGRVIVELTTG